MGKYYDKLIQMNENLDKELMEKGVVNAELNANDKLVKDDKTDIVKEDGENTIEISKDSLTDDQKKEILLDKGVDQKAIDNLKSSEALDGALTAATANDVKQESGAVELSDIDWDGPAILKYDNPNEPDHGGFYVNDKEWSSDIKRATEFDSKEDAQKKIDELVASGDFDGKYLYIWSAQSKLDESDGAVKVEDDIDESVILRMDDDDLDMHGFVKKFENGEIEWTNDEQEAERFQHEELGQNKIEAICTKFHYDPSTFTIKSVDPRADEPYVDDEESQNWVSLDPMHPGATTLP